MVSVLSTALGSGTRSAIFLSRFIKPKKYIVLEKLKTVSYLGVCHSVVDTQATADNLEHFIVSFACESQVTPRGVRVGGLGFPSQPSARRMGRLGPSLEFPQLSPRAACSSEGHYEKLLYEPCHSESFTETQGHK